MSLQGHVVELQRRHEALEKELEQERLRPTRDDMRVFELKKKKLLIKDELSKLKEVETLH